MSGQDRLAPISSTRVNSFPVTDLADAADVRRQPIYLRFGARDALLVAARCARHPSAVVLPVLPLG